MRAIGSALISSACLAFLLGFAFSAVADEPGRVSRHFGGMAKNFYLGLEGVQNFTFVDYSHRDTYLDVIRGDEKLGQCATCFVRDEGEHGWAGRFSLGYGKFFRDRWHMGLEINATKGNGELNKHNIHGTSGRELYSALEFEGSYQAVLRPGFRVNDGAAVFLRLGAERGKFRLFHEQKGDVPPGASASYSDSRWETAWVAGFDHEVQSKDERLGLRLGWEYADYGNLGALLSTWPGFKGAHGNADTKKDPGIRNWDTAVVTFKAGFVWRPWAEKYGDNSSSAYHDFGGFYGGIKGGYSAAEESFREEGKSARHVAMHDPQVGATLGWGKQFKDRYYAGFDLNYAPGINAEIKLSAIESTIKNREEAAWLYSHKQERKHDADASLRLGYLMAPESMVYVKAGYAISKWNFTTNPTELWKTKNGVPIEFIESSGGSFQSKRMKGPKLGLGIDSVIKNKWIVRSEWSYTRYGRERLDDKKTTEPNSYAFSMGVIRGF